MKKLYILIITILLIALNWNNIVSASNLISEKSITSINAKIDNIKSDKKDELLSALITRLDILISQSKDSKRTEILTELKQIIKNKLDTLSKDVVKNSDVSYRAPDWTVSMNINLVTKNWIIKSATVTQKAQWRSWMYQDNFVIWLSSANIVWKKASELNLDAIWGASLTTNAFVKFVRSSI